jgi:hypothetical protein
MKQPISRSRKDYKRAYKLLRLYCGLPKEDQTTGETNEIEDCAILSYDYRDSEFSGWINRQRQERFEECQGVRKTK